jgi:predicted transcriptional regulator of viral defense system
MHRAAASCPGGYFTGAYALARHRLLLEDPPRVDMVVPDRPGPELAWGGFAIRRLRLGLAAFTAGLETHRDGGREIALAGPERVLVDALSHPGKILPIEQTARLFRERKTKLRQARLLDLVVRLGSEAVFRRMRVMAEHAGMVRLGRWLAEEGGIRPAMGRTRLDPAAPVPPGAPVRFGVIVNVPLDGAGPGAS